MKPILALIAFAPRDVLPRQTFEAVQGGSTATGVNRSEPGAQ